MVIFLQIKFYLSYTFCWKSVTTFSHIYLICRPQCLTHPNNWLSAQYPVRRLWFGMPFSRRVVQLVMFLYKLLNNRVDWCELLLLISLRILRQSSIHVVLADTDFSNKYVQITTKFNLWQTWYILLFDIWSLQDCRKIMNIL